MDLELLEPKKVQVFTSKIFVTIYGVILRILPKISLICYGNRTQKGAEK
jgi:hypothetical protein